MQSVRQGSIHLFRLAGVDLYLHWSWFLVAAYEIESRKGRYSSVAWNALEYLALFSIVLMHEFGHALACRQVGGTANQIVLWPLGGVAYVNPPQRPGATLWSIAAGPLVNVVLLPVFVAAFMLSRSLGWAHAIPDAYQLLRAVMWIDVSLLVFNLMPIYPLDGGQILRSLLWFVLGRGFVVTFLLVRCDFRFYADELLGWTTSCAGAVTNCKAAAPGRVCLPELPDSATVGSLLAMRTVRAAI